MSEPEERPKHYLRRAYTEHVGWGNRLLLPFGFFVVAIQQDTALALVLALLWSLWTAQFTLSTTFNRGWLAGSDWHQENAGQMHVAMGDLLDLCQKHGVPPQEIAELIWKEQ